MSVIFICQPLFLPSGVNPAKACVIEISLGGGSRRVIKGSGIFSSASELMQEEERVLTRVSFIREQMNFITN